MNLDLYIDFKSPASYLAYKPTLSLISTYAPQVTWHPYNTVQSAIPAEQEQENQGESHRRVRAIARQSMHLKYAALQGAPMQFPDTPQATDLALNALLHLDGDPLAFIEAAYQAYWVNQQSLNDAEVVNSLLEHTGYLLKVDELSPAALEDHQLQAETEGVVDTPAYVLDDQLFIGREHLPWITEILQP